MKNRLILILSLIIITSFTGCSKYSQEWQCGIIKGIGCADLEKSEAVAKDQIILNTESLKSSELKGKLEIKEHYEGFKKVKKKIIEGIE